MKIQAGKNAGFHRTHTARLAAYRQKLHRHCSSCVALGAQADLRYSKGAIRVKQAGEGNRGRDTHASESSLPNHTAGNVRADGICTERGGGEGLRAVALSEHANGPSSGALSATGATNGSPNDANSTSLSFTQLGSCRMEPGEGRRRQRDSRKTQANRQGRGRTHRPGRRVS